MKHHFCHRKLLLEASDFVNLPSPDLPLQNTTQQSSSPHSFNLKTVIVLLAIFLVFFLFTIFSIYIRRFTERRLPFSLPPLLPPQTAADSSANGVDRAVVESLPVFAYRHHDKFQVECAICLIEFAVDERVKTIPFCGHVFHPECIDTWLFSHVSCPVCRSTQFFSKKGGVGDGTASGGRLTVENGETGVEVGTRGVRRISSCSNFSGRGSLERTLTF